MQELFHKLNQKLMNLFGDSGNSISRMFNKEDESIREIFSYDSLANILPYEAFDEEHGIFINKNSIGFVVEAVCLVGADEAVQKEISSIFYELLEEGESIQCLLLADHRINPFLDAWEKSRNDAKEIYQEIAKKRAEFLKDSSRNSSRIFRFILSYSAPLKGADQILLSVMKEKKERILKTLSTLTYAFIWDAEKFLETVGSIINFSLKTNVIKRDWNPYQTLTSQLPRGGALKIEKDCINWVTEAEVTFKSYRVVDFPDHWSLNAMQSLIGDVFRDNFRINVPFYLHYGVHCPKQSKEETRFTRNSHLIEKQGASRSLLDDSKFRKRIARIPACSKIIESR